MKATRALSLMVLSVLLTVLFGCASSHPHLMATPVIYKDERLDIFSDVPADLRTTTVPVFYATSRKPLAPGKDSLYSAMRSDEGIQLGLAQVGLGEPGWTFDDLVASDRTSSVDKPRPGRVERIEAIGNVYAGEARTDAERQFVRRINEYLAKVRSPEIVLYVHGYRVSFEEVSVLMGSLSTYLGKGATVAFQWPTGGHFWNYGACTDAEEFIPDIERLIELLSHTEAEYINMIGYSCGSPLLASALAHLRGRFADESREQLTKRFRIGSVVFAGSDVDLKRFAREHVPGIMDLAQQTNVYISLGDRALGFSTMVAGTSRIGRPDIKELRVEDLQNLAKDPRLYAIDVTDVRGDHEMGGMRGHGYWYANEWIASDVLVSLRLPLSPEDRCLIPDKTRQKIWLFPDNYQDCVADRIYKTFPVLGAKGLEREANPAARITRGEKGR
ncbi:alpha/beta hydrolase [Nitrospira sp. BLG_1]|uniref:alpha/beta hydrolase n=1 Tax=Nitrospira sp. BLG_1 TaxID=3395883 RepID=UPI0039BCE7AA